MSNVLIERLLLLGAHLRVAGIVVFHLLILAALVWFGCRFTGVLANIFVVGAAAYVGMVLGLLVALFVVKRAQR